MHDALIFTPDDVDLSRSPLRRGIAEPTYVLGAFNPGFTRLPNGNLLLMVRIAEALAEPVRDGQVHAIRWTPAGYVLDDWPLTDVDLTDPRQFELKGRRHRILALTSLSWLLPVELDPSGEHIVAVHYDAAIEPAATYQDYGVEDARITRVGDTWYMTTCSVGAERHCTTLHTSRDGLHYRLEGIVLDHQNKDMILFEGLVADRFMALTRPLGEVYFAYPPDSPWVGGPSINFAASPDALHWKPLDAPGLRARKGSTSAMKIGGGTQPILTPNGWMMIYHGVEARESVGIYRSFWALLDRDDPSRILRVEDEVPLLEANPALTAHIAHQMYLPTPVVFSTGLVTDGDDYLIASGEADLACRITRLPKSRFV
ncbi:glycosidase [Sphingomonas melonis TY]|jgi:beta-1,2-mannobiose phosphorylase / 1,2-beta-oligomannan phosphorylase|nr:MULTISPECIES: glycosidase [Sphingomonas]AOW22975.1 glycosidase [Sphingomonas melonis TY]ATI56389.1 glycosidase [Sphingomonas melonis]KZB95207.1 glycosidase [Sphingomonas melonis TY]MBI0529891.1 glycosidase [Sphingomonas sp. TX0522]MBX8846669.1 glycosidase [Sphingomonas melonis]